MLNDDIRLAIERSLPAEAGKVIQARLALCDKLEADNKFVQERLRTLEKRLASQEDLERRAVEILKREEAMAKAEREMEVNKARLEVERQMGQAMREQNLQVVLAVFGNNRFKYEERRSDGVAFPGVPTPSNSYPSPQTTTISSERTITGEGDPPRT